MCALVTGVQTCALPIYLQLRADVQPGVEAMRLARREFDAGADGLRTIAASFARLGAVSHGFGRRRHDRGNKVMLQYRDPAAGLLCLERVIVELIECGFLEPLARKSVGKGQSGSVCGNLGGCGYF